jgi:hypothetical protein
MAVSIKELQTLPDQNVQDSSDKIFTELQLIRKTIAAAVFALGSDEQIRRYYQYMDANSAP